MDDNRSDGRTPIMRSTTSDQTSAGSGGSLGDTITGIIEDLQNIIRGEVQLAKTEIKEDAGKLGKALGMIGAAAFLALVGFIFLMLGVTYLLNKFIELWMAAGLVGLVLLLIGAFLGMRGKNQMQEANMVPDKAIESLKEDKEWASRQINSVKK
jgi:uncharacterized membrane protein YqjE